MCKQFYCNSKICTGHSSVTVEWTKEEAIYNVREECIDYKSLFMMRRVKAKKVMRVEGASG